MTISERHDSKDIATLCLTLLARVHMSVDSLGSISSDPNREPRHRAPDHRKERGGERDEVERGMKWREE